MTTKLSPTVRNARLDAIEVATGASAIMKFRTGAQPGGTQLADAGTVCATLALPADWMSPASGGVKSLLGTWNDPSADATGNPGHFRIYASDGTTCHYEGSAGVPVNLSTNGTTAANNNVLNFAATTGVVVGMNVSGAGIPAGATVLAVTGTTVTLSHASVAGVANAAAIQFSYDLSLDAATINAGQSFTVTAFSWVEPHG